MLRHGYKRDFYEELIKLTNIMFYLENEKKRYDKMHACSLS